MPQMLLTDVAIRALGSSDPSVTYFDLKLPGFGVRVGKRAKTFIMMRGHERQRIKIGRYPDMPLAVARTKARELMTGAAEPPTSPVMFADVRDAFITEKYEILGSAWPKQIRSVLNLHFKCFEKKKLAEISDRDIAWALQQVERPGARLHAFRVLKALFNWSVKPPRRYLPYSPMTGYDPPGQDRRRTRILSDDELEAVWNASGKGSRQIFRLMILWGTRSTETTKIERPWIKGDVLTIPGFQAGRRITKSGRDHGIPLLPLAQSILANCSPGQFFFPGRYSSDVTLNSESLFRMRHEIQQETGTSDWHAHDLRRTFRSNMARLGIERDLCERLINHAPPVLDEIYDRYDRLKEKRIALARYEEFLLELLGVRAAA